VPDTAVDRQWYAVDGDPTTGTGLDNGAGHNIYLVNDEIGPGADDGPVLLEAVRAFGGGNAARRELRNQQWTAEPLTRPRRHNLLQPRRRVDVGAVDQPRALDPRRLKRCFERRQVDVLGVAIDHRMIWIEGMDSIHEYWEKSGKGFGAGAEYGGAVILAVEYAPPGRRGLFGSWAPLGVVVGNLLAVAVFALVSLLSKDQFLAWGWRIPFLLSILLVAIGLFIRARVAETPVFAAVKRDRPALKAPVWRAMRDHPKSFLVVIGSRLAENGLGYLFPVFGLSYVVNTLHLPRSVGLTGVICGNAAELVGVVFFSWLSDHVGRRPVYMAGALFSAVFAFPFFILLDTKDPALIALAFILIMGIGGGGMFGPQAAYFAELFGPRLRYSGFAFARELGSILAGGPAPFLSALLVAWLNGAPWGVAYYVIVLSLITAVSVWWGPETVRADIGADALIAEEQQGAGVPRPA